MAEVQLVYCSRTVNREAFCVANYDTKKQKWFLYPKNEDRPQKHRVRNKDYFNFTVPENQHILELEGVYKNQSFRVRLLVWYDKKTAKCRFELLGDVEWN